MSIHTSIHWCDSVENPVMGCDGCPLFPSPSKVTSSLVAFLKLQGVEPGHATTLVTIPASGLSLTEIHLRRHQIAHRIARALRWKPRQQRELERAIASQVSCYAATLHLRRSLNVTKPAKKGHKGYAPVFEQVTAFPGRMARAAHWKPLNRTSRPEKPWLDGLPRLIFVSDMGDALSGAASASPHRGLQSCRFRRPCRDRHRVHHAP